MMYACSRLIYTIISTKRNEHGEIDSRNKTQRYHDSFYNLFSSEYREDCINKNYIIYKHC